MINHLHTLEFSVQIHLQQSSWVTERHTMITVSKFNVRVVNKGEKYGLDFCLTHNSDKPLVEFYDTRYPHTEFGQFVSRYYVETILGEDGYGSEEGGLNLDGGIPEWTVSAKDMETVRNFLKGVAA